MPVLVTPAHAAPQATDPVATDAQPGGAASARPSVEGAGEIARATAEGAELLAPGSHMVAVGPVDVLVARGERTVGVPGDPATAHPRPSGPVGPGLTIVAIAIVALVLLFRAFQHWTAVRAGYPIRWGKRIIERGTGADVARSLDGLAGENARLRAQVMRLEERVAVLERIATDPARRLSADIDALR